MNKKSMVAGLALLGAVALTAKSSTAHAGGLNITIGEPGYYQPTYVQRGYRSQPDWEQEREARQHRAMDWREHHRDDRYGERGQDRKEVHRDHQNRNHDNRGDGRNHQDHRH